MTIVIVVLWSNILHYSSTFYIDPTHAQFCIVFSENGTMSTLVWKHLTENQDTQCVVRPKKPAYHTVSIVTRRTTMQFSHIRSFMMLLWNRRIFAMEMSFTVSTPQSKINHTRRFWDINFKNWPSFFIYKSLFSSFRQSVKVAI